MAAIIEEDARVRLRPEFAVIPLTGEKVLLRSPDQAVRVSVDGVSAPTLARLLSGLDGRTPASGAGIRRSEVLRLVQGLAQREIVEVNPSAPRVRSERCFARFHDAAACPARLDSAHVLVRGGGAIADVLVEDFRHAGVGVVTRSVRDRKEGCPSGRRSDDGAALLRACRKADLTIVVSDTGDGRTPDEQALNDFALEYGFAWCPVRIFGSVCFG